MSYTLIATGDVIMFHPIEEREGSPYSDLKRGTHNFINMEIPLTNSEEANDKGVVLKAPPSIAQELKTWGVDVATVANNHALDYGIEGLRETIRSLVGAGIATVGGGENLAESLRPAFKDYAGGRVAFLGLTTTLPNGANAGAKRPGLAPVRVLTKIVLDPVTLQEFPGSSPFVETEMVWDDVEQVKQAVAAAAKEADYVIVGIHWGLLYGWIAGFQDELATYQQILAHELIDAGASAIIGNHSHYLHGIEFYKNSPIFYSLGIFTLQHVDLDDGEGALARNFPPYDYARIITADITNYGALAELTWQPGEVCPICKLTPLRLKENGEPRYATAEEAQVVLDHISKSSRRFGTSASLVEDEDRTRILLGH